jgi:hypothetical protein
MQKSGANAGAQDALIQQLITRASIKIMRDYGREFVPGGTESLTAIAAPRTFEYQRADQLYTGEVFVDLHPYDLQLSPVPTVAVDTDLASSITLTTDDYRLWPRPASQGVYMAIRISSLSVRGPWSRFNSRQLTITGNWGFPTVPFEVEQACAETVIHWLTAYPAANRPQQPDSIMPPIQPRSYPMAAIDLLCTFKRMIG